MADHRDQPVRPRRIPALSPAPELRETILAATLTLLAQRSFAELTIAEILSAAGVARGSFYFYFDSKHDVLAELVRRAVARGHDAARPWLTHPPDPIDALRSGITAGVRLWRENAPVLRAIVENWRTEPRLTALWSGQMQTFTDATIAQISADPAAQLMSHDIEALAAAMTWLGERLYYLAAIDAEPFNDEQRLIDTLLYIWTSVLYRETH